MKIGYSIVTLSKNGKSYKEYIHRLVAKTFLSNPLNKEYVNHKDGNKQNNCVSNLEWCTPSENNYHAFQTGLKKTTDKQRKQSIENGKLYCSKKNNSI